MMLSSSASRREAKSGELPKAASVAIRDSAANSNKMTVAAAAAEQEPRASTMKDSAHHEGWMVRYGRRKIGRSFFHTRYFVLDTRLLAYYKKKPKDNMVQIRFLDFP
ncbi:hypothetical protein ABZP36_008365 [Zizania latifolia]